MIVGFILAVFVAVFFVALTIVLGGSTGFLKENLATGAVVGTSQAVSYSLIVLVVSFVCIVAIVFIMRRKLLVIKGAFN